MIMMMMMTTTTTMATTISTTKTMMTTIMEITPSLAGGRCPTSCPGGGEVLVVVTQ